MKKLITIIFCLMAFSSIALAQFLPYLPTEQLAKAREEAASILTEPKLVAVATLTGTLPGMELVGKIQFDNTDTDSKGKSTVWIYLFNNIAEPENIQAITIAWTMVGVMPVNVTQFVNNLSALTDIALTKSLDDVEWLNSNEMLPYLKSSVPYTNFMSSYPDGIPKYIVLGYADYANLDPDTPYWFVTMTDESDTLLIVVNALDGTVTDVNENSTDGTIISVYPNPAQDFAFVQIPERKISENYSIKLYDLLGNSMITEIKISSIQSKIDLRNLVTGKYSIHVNNGKENKVLPIIIDK